MKYLFILIIFSFFELSATPLLSYRDIEPELKKAWEEAYPVAYTKISEKDLLKKGILYVRKGKVRLYLYTFKLFIPLYSFKDKTLQVEDPEKGKEIPVKLYYKPQDKEKPYFVELGEIQEFKNRSLIIQYIRK
ncbi:MAG: hypothetical protein H7A25_23445 [Leptospiraceae bacterium]|nr:hypothetical protein [Leptospiraceae bacterium]MCP5502875.1 hypothetical protein [Leptospiraceae bacterium]